MKGIIIRGMYELKRGKTMLIIIGLFLFELIISLLSFLNPEMSGDPMSCWVVSAICLVCLSITFSTINAGDSECGWDVYCVNSSVGRKGFASGQYIVYLIVNAVLVLVSLVYPVILQIKFSLMDTGDFILGITALICIAQLLSCITIPIMVFFGKHQFLVMFFSEMILLEAAGVFLSASDINAELVYEDLVKGHSVLIAAAVLAFTAFFTVLSWILSKKLISKREFG